ncbi:TetR/AcrR family transcriptional regulator [Lysinibacter cavernae]|uniref:AcrR family transcriptional regulator n=1 Tax=Lysinibacter cavernae TaxID=1640652 RepID=A0A7X5TT68_9MICO|nr:TetR/AcrR family transcriptional regulator [Lysinibacter cavernae]NIH54291.1 AcrR family transcriptional regulator [Lysinibacter cavernae]
MKEHRSGPVRSAAAREAILEATARQFHREGYDRLTIEGIAKEAGVGKQTIYRWWPSRGALIADCLAEGRLFPLSFDVPHTADIVADVEVWLDTVLAILNAPQGNELLRSLVAAAAEDAAVGDHLGASLGVDRSLTQRVQAGVNAGELPADTPTEQLGQVLIGTIVLRTLGRMTDHAEPMRQLIRFLLTPRP